MKNIENYLFETKNTVQCAPEPERLSLMATQGLAMRSQALK